MRSLRKVYPAAPVQVAVSRFPAWQNVNHPCHCLSLGRTFLGQGLKKGAPQTDFSQLKEPTENVAMSPVRDNACET